MKKIILSLCAVAALCACAKEDVISASQEAIGFGNAFVDNSVRAAVDPSYSANDIKSFQVYGTVNGVLIYPGTTITKGNAAYGAAWTCPVTQYWIDGANYIFDAVVDATEVTTDVTTGLPTSLNYDAATQKDMLYQRVTTVGKPETNNGLVAFTFTHLLSKVKFTVNNSTSTVTNYKYVITDINIANAYKSGEYDVATGAWTPSTEVLDQTFGDITATAASTECDAEKLLIPGLESVTVEFVVNLYYVNGESESLISTTPYTVDEGTAKTVAITGGLKAGNAYDFNITVSVGEEIKFTVTKQPTWTDSGDISL